MFRLLLFLSILSSALGGFSQSASKNVIHQELLWFNYTNTLLFNEKYFLITELNDRRYIEELTLHQENLRIHFHFKFKNEWDIAPGFIFFLQYPHDPKSTSELVVPELRPFIQISNKNKLNDHFSINHQYIAEWRFFRNNNSLELTDGYNNNFRFRYRLGVDILLTKFNNHPFKLKIFDEIHINAGKNIVYNHFDQNRIYVGLNYEWNTHLSTEVGYLNWHQQTVNGTDFFNRNILRLAILHKITLKNA
ncbi:MAG: DUF2490 domain-containing protein [Bacteroidia bacterium]